MDAEIPSPAAGVLKEIKVNEGQTVPIQTVVAVIDADGAGAAAASPAPAKPASRRKAAGQQQPLAAASAQASSPQKPATSSAPALALRRAFASHARRAAAAAATAEKIRSSPLVRRIAREHNVDLSQVPGTGAGGRVSKNDILRRHRGRRPRQLPQAGAAPSRSGRSALPRPPPPPAAGGALHPRCSKRPCRAKKCTSATTKCSPCP